jgi:acyl-coenzyme A synthetase/AMP-(fatty) acid ligase
VPKEFVVVNELPKNPAGKILKRELKKTMAG